MSGVTNPASYLKAAGKLLEKSAACAVQGPWSADLTPDEDVWAGPLVLGPEHIDSYGEPDNFVMATTLGPSDKTNAVYMALMHPGMGLKLAKGLINIGEWWESCVSWESYDEGYGGYWYCETCDGTVEGVGHEDPCTCPGSMFLPLARSIVERENVDTQN